MKSKVILVGVTVLLGVFLTTACPQPSPDLWSLVQAQYQNLQSFSAEILTVEQFHSGFATSTSETFIFCFPFVRLSNPEPPVDSKICPTGICLPKRIQQTQRIQNIQTGQTWILYDNGVWEEFTDKSQAGRHQLWLAWLEKLDLQNFFGAKEIGVAELDGKKYWLIKGYAEHRLGPVEVGIWVDCQSLFITKVDLEGGFFKITKSVTNFSPNVEVDAELFAPPPEELITTKFVIVPNGRAILARIWDKLRTLKSFMVRKQVEDDLGAYEQVVVYRYPFLREEVHSPDISFVNIIDFSSGVTYKYDPGEKNWTKYEDKSLRLLQSFAFYIAVLSAFSLPPAQFLLSPVDPTRLGVEERTWHGRKVWRIVVGRYPPGVPQPECWVDQETLAIHKYVKPKPISEFDWTKITVNIVRFEANPDIPAELFALPAQAEERRVPKLPARPEPKEEVRDLAPPLNWEPFSFTRVEEAKAQGKGVVLYFSAKWCEPCHRLEASPFRDPRVQELLSPFVLLKVDLTEYKGGARETARTFRATVLPTLVFLSPEGKEIGRIIGYTSVLFIEIQKILKGGEK